MATPPKLTFADRQFLLDGKPLRIFSAAIHYFRVVPEYWRDRLTKAKACGINTLETYVPWNLHEPAPGKFRCDGLLDVRRFIQLAGELGLHVIFRPGPYICSEWDFGGLPSWLLADQDMKVRSNYPGYTHAVERFFGWLLPLTNDLQRSHGGPIIAVQVENEFGSFSDQPEHLVYIRDLLRKNGVVELLVSCDNESAVGSGPIIDGVLPTANGHTVGELKPQFEVIRQASGQHPLLVMEFWCGWFDHWGGQHETRGLDMTREALTYCLQQDASVNFYMFHGGTNFGFMSGALDLSRYKADTTSYDYDAPLSEEGCLTEKALMIRDMIREEVAAKNLDMEVSSSLPPNPTVARKAITLGLDETMTWGNLIASVKKRAKTRDLDYMESFVYDNGDVQSYGYIIYRKEVEMPQDATLALPGPVRDRVSVVVNGTVQGVLTRDGEEENPNLLVSRPDSTENITLDITVENLGRVNYTLKEKQDVMNNQRKGLKGAARLGETDLHDYEVIALDFNEEFVKQLKNESWSKLKSRGSNEINVPAIFKSSLVFSKSANICDYFVSMENWGKGLVFVNGFNLGRYWEIGPTKTLYLPTPLLKKGHNEIIVFEEIKIGDKIKLEVQPSLEPIKAKAKI